MENATFDIKEEGDNYTFECNGVGCGYTKRQNPIVTYDGYKVTVEFELYDIVSESLLDGKEIFYLKYNNGNYNLIKIEKK